MRRDTYSRGRDTYTRGQGTRRSGSNRRYRQEQYQGSGNGWILFGMLGLFLVGSYFLMEEDQQIHVTQVIEEGFNWVKQQVTQTIENEPTSQVNQSVPVETDVPLTQANLSKILAYTLMDIENLETSRLGEAWYSKYYTVLEGDERFQFLQEDYAMNPLTYQEAQSVISVVLGDDYQVILPVDNELGEQYIQTDDFLNFYEQGFQQIGKSSGIQYKEVSVLATPATKNSLEAWTTLTDDGFYGFEGVILDPYKDATIQVAIIDDEILGIVDLVSTQSVIPNCFIEKVEDGTVTVDIAGTKFSYSSEILTKQAEGQMGQITIYNSEIIDYSLQGEENVDVIIRMTNDEIEFANAGILPYHDELLVYSNIQEGNYSSINQLFSGVEVSYTLKDGEVTTIKVVGDTLENQVRVVLTQDGLGQYLHDTVVMTSAQDCNITYGDKKLKLEAGAVWDISTFEWGILPDKLIITPEENGTIEIQSMTRQKIYPNYVGSLEIYKEDLGYNIVNIVDMESYIAHVIPSEMPTSYGLEAAKVQAVAARSYATVHQTNSKFLRYGAQLDDTTMSQVYNNVATSEQSQIAAQETAGEVMTYDGKVISGNFFATSAGYTANYGETWAMGETFPTNTPVYLSSEQQYIGMRDGDTLNDEEAAAAFFALDATEVDAFDSHSPWFRWEVEFNKETLNAVINSNIYRLTTQYPDMVKVLDVRNNVWVEGEIESIGEVENLEIRERGSGGNIMEMVIFGDEEIIQVSTEYLIRSLLAPIQKDPIGEPIQIVRADGSTIENMAMLPSAFFSMDIDYKGEAIESMRIYGGGFGHGVGMSQDGVKGMVERGYNYYEILEHYYTNIEIEIL